MQWLLMGTLLHEGVLMSKALYRPNDTYCAKWESRIDPSQYEQVVYMLDLDISQPQWLCQLKKGMGGFYGANAMISVTPKISGGAEVFFLQPQKRSGVGFALRYADAKAVATAQARPWDKRHTCPSSTCMQSGQVACSFATWALALALSKLTLVIVRSGSNCKHTARHVYAAAVSHCPIYTLQVATTGVVNATYMHRISDKATMAADFLYNANQREAVASVGYDYSFKQCRLRGCVDSEFKVAAFLEEQLGPGIKLLLSGELDHAKGDHKFGFGMTVGE